MEISGVHVIIFEDTHKSQTFSLDVIRYKFSCVYIEKKESNRLEKGMNRKFKPPLPPPQLPSRVFRTIKEAEKNTLGP